MKNLRRKLMLTSFVLCGSVALGFGLLDDNTAKVSANTVDGFDVVSASLRVPDGEYGEGIRYTVTVNAEDIEDGATTGVLMIPTSSLGNSELSLALENNDLRNYALSWKNLGETKEAYVHLYDIPAEQYATSISMCAYIQNPDSDPIYTTVKETSVAEVAVWAIEKDTSLSEADKESLKASYLTYEVNYYDDDETLLKTTTAVYNETLTVYTPEKDGYEFAGWWNKAGTHQWNFETMTVSATTTNLYAKWNVAVDEVLEARENEPNTLLFFDQSFGVQQVIGATGNSFAYSTEKAYGDEDGSLKVTFPGTETHNTVTFDMKNYAFAEDDYIVFYAYNDTTLNNAILSFGYSNGISLTKGSWTPVVRKASLITASGMNYFRLLGMKESTSGWGGATSLDGNVYFSKVTVCSADQVTDLTSVTGDWTIGDTTFTGAVTKYNNAMGVLDSYLNDALTYAPYKLGDVVNMKIFKHSYAGFYAKLKTPVDASTANQYISITVKGTNADVFTILPFNEAGGVWSGALKAIRVTDAGNGFVTYTFMVEKASGRTIAAFRVTPLGDTSSISVPADISISNFTVGGVASLRTGVDKNTLYFTDSTIAVKEAQFAKDDNVASVSYSTEMAYGNEQGSLKASGITHGSTGYVKYYLSDADKEFLADTDYVVFYLYITSSTRLFFAINYEYATTGCELMPNAWTKVVVPAAKFKTGTWFQLHPQGQAADGNTFAMYMSKVVRYSASEVTKLADKAATDTWSVGSTEFVGVPTIANGPTNTGYEAGTEHKKAQIIDNELVVTFIRTGDGYINLKLANSIEVAANTEVYITLVMYNYGRLNKLNGYINSSGSYGLSYVSQEDVGGGYAKVTLKCSAKEAAYTITSVRFDVEDHTGTGSGLATQFRIKDIAIEKKNA